MCKTIERPAETRPYHPKNHLHKETARHLRRAVACLVKLNELHAEHCTDELCSCDAFNAYIWHLELYANTIHGETLYTEEGS